MKIFWEGSDVLFLYQYPPGTRLRFRIKIFAFRIMARLIKPFVFSHLCDHEFIKDELERKKFKPVDIIPTFGFEPRLIPRAPHSAFNILYYIPFKPHRKNPEFTKWLYGYDIIQRLRDNGFEIVEVHNQEQVELMLPYTDFYLRPMRHDVASRLRQQCEFNGIPYYWTQTNPDYNDAVNAIAAAMADWLINVKGIKCS